MPTVEYATGGHVALITLNRPDRLNALGDGMPGELLEALERAAGDGIVRAVVLTGAGRGFCAGGDLATLHAPRTEGGRTYTMRELLRITELLHDMPKATIAAVNGPAAGAGMSIACACDLRIAAESAFFTAAFLAAGQTGDYGLSWTLPRLVGEGRARELMLLNDRVPAAEAVRIGLATRVVPDAELLTEARSVADRLAAAAPLAVAGMKANLTDGAQESLATTLDRETLRFAVNNATDDAKEAARAFVEKRPPVFHGR